VQDSPVEVGVKLRSDVAGYLTAIRFYKQPNNTGTHVGHIWSSSGTRLAEVEFESETASGWQEERLADPVPISEGETLVVSYHSSAGRFAFSPGYFGSAVNRGPLHSPAAFETGNGVYRYGSSGFPTATFNATNYWVDAVFDTVMPPDTRPPKVSSVAPANGAAGVALTSSVTATFDEPVDPETVNAGSLVLSDTSGDAVPGTVTYDASTRRATLNPQAQLETGEVYTARVKSGTAGVADLAGNRIAADKAWTFATPARCPCTLFASNQEPGGSAVQDQPLEIGVKFRTTEDGFITSLRFYKQANNVGTHVGHLWSATGQLLATAPYTDETASGWQEAWLENPVPVNKDTTYVASYHSSAGWFAFSPGFFNSSVDRAPMQADSSSIAGGNGVFRYGPSGFPTSTFNATNYWVDASFERVIGPDTRGPSITALTPANNASSVPRGAAVTAAFDEPLDPGSVTGANFTLRDPDGNLQDAAISYDAQTRTARLQPDAPLAYATTYSARLKGGSGGIADASGNPLSADRNWSFTTASQSPADGPGGPVLLVADPNDKFSYYYAEILRSEGLSAFTVVDAPLTTQKLAGKQVVVLAAPVTDAEVTLLSSWVSGGGNLVAMRPDKKLAGLLGLTDAGGTRTNQYMKVDTGTSVGAGIEPMSMQYHSTGDRYTLNGASAIARYWSNRTTATSDPAVTLRSVGTGGGQAAAFTYDLARGVVYTRQGNPAWAGQKRDGTPNGSRATDMFYGAKAGDVQPDWTDPERIEVPQADEQQRLLVNLITEMNLDKAPLPRFWYLPRGEKAAIVMTGDDHATNGSSPYFDRLKASSPAGCSVARWECVRASTYIFPNTPMGDAQAAAYESEGFEIALHPNTACQDFTAATFDTTLASQLGQLAAAFPNIRPPVTSRTHCITWSDWASEAKVEAAHGIRLDTNYYYDGPPGWLTEPGLLTGSGFPQRFADVDGSFIDNYQAMSQVVDEMQEQLPIARQVETLLDNALGSRAYYGVLTLNLHSDYGDHDNANDAVSEAQARGVPVVSGAQMLDWLDGRNGSSFANLSYGGNQLSFTVNTNARAEGLEGMLPARSATGPLKKLTRNGQAASRDTRTVKGVDYVVFKATAGDYVATYGTDDAAPEITGLTATPDSEGHATVTWSTDEPASSLLEYGRTATLGTQVSDSARVTEHSIELSNLSPGTTYHFRVTSADTGGNTATSPSGAPATFQTPPGALVDTRMSEFGLGTKASVHTGGTLGGNDGEVQLQPTVGEEFEGPTLPVGWTSSPWGSGGTVSVSGGSLVADGAVGHTTALFSAPRVLEFAATFDPVHDEAVGFSNNFTDFPVAAFMSGKRDGPIQMSAWSGSSGGTERVTPLPGVSFGSPHRFRIEWNATSAAFYVDGALVATHPLTVDGDMRPVAHDYGLLGAGVKLHWVRQSTYATSGTFTSRVLDSGPGAVEWSTLSSTRAVPSGTSIAFDTRSGSTATPGGTWSAWQPVSGSGAIASPPSRFIQYRARMTGTSSLTPTLERVAVAYAAGTDQAPVAGAVAIAPANPRTNQTVTATPSGFSDPDGDPLTYHYQWLRNGTPIAGATSSSLNLSTAGNGDRADAIRVEVYATDGRGAASDAVSDTETVANTAPTAGTATLKPAVPSTNDVLVAQASGYADIDGDDLGYTYRWFRNGTIITGETGRTLDLALPNNGNLNDLIEVEVSAVDGNGGTSPAARVGKTITGTNATPVEGTVAIAPTSPRTAQLLTATPTGFREPDGDPLSYSYRWLRNGTAIGGATSATLDLSAAGNGDRGDVIRVEVSAGDGRGAVSETVADAVTVANADPTGGSVSLKPATPATNDVMSAVASAFTDPDGDALSYRYRWFRNGTEISGETGRTLDLAEPGNGDLGDLIEVEVEALDGNGGTSAVIRRGKSITGTASSPVASFGFEEASGNVAVDDAGGRDGQLENGTSRSDAGRFGRAVEFDGTDDIVTVPDDAALRLTGGMTMEAWVRPAAATNWRTVIFKEAAGGLAYGLYANSDTDVPSVYLNGAHGVKGTSDLDPNAWSHLAATYDGTLLRLYVNGSQVASTSLPGGIGNGEGPLSFGSNAVWGEQFRGLIDEVRIYNRALSATEIQADRDRPVVDGTPTPPSDTTPAAIGSFGAPQSWPIVPVHLSMTSDGKVAAWDGFEAAVNSERKWDPATEQFQAIPNGRNLFCAGHITLQDGRLLVAGGHLQAYEGIRDTNLFNPQSNTWSRGADMSVARWYPTVTGLPNGRVFVAAGDGITLNEGGQSVPLTNASNTLPEIYNPANDTWTSLPSAARRMPLYPFLFVLPDGRLFDAGPDTTTRVLDLGSGQWSTVGTSPIDGQSAVMYRPGKILKSGTWADPEFPGLDVTDRAAAIDMTDAAPAWRETATMKYRRAYHTLTVLPDGNVLATGGQTASDGVDGRTGILAAEMWDPVADRWTTMASHRRPRLYHSSSLLLPDGRVLLAGGGAFGNATNEKSAEIYSPPYLFKGPRPTITDAPGGVHYGGSFTVDTPDASRIQSASLVRMGSVTHNFDMDQRFIPLNTTPQSGGVTVSGPSDANVAPPGWYMLFLVDDQGVPSVSKIVKVDASVDAQAPTTPGGLQATRSGTTVQLNWSAATDNVGVTAYRVHRSTTSGFTPTAANRIATVGGTSHSDTDVPPGTYFYRVVAADAAGNASPASTQASVTVPDATAPTVAVTAPTAGATVSGATVGITATASDNVGVQSVQFRVDGTNLGAADTSNPYSATWDSRLVADGTHTLSAVARDAAGNTTTSSNVSVTVANMPAGAVAAYGFEETSGSTAVDQKGVNNGTISGATRTTAGRFGRALSYDGINDRITVPHHVTLTPSNALTVESWVNPSALSGVRSVATKERASSIAYALYAHNSTNRPRARLFTTSDLTTDGTAALPLNAWSHLAMTWDGTTLRLYVNGLQVSSRAVGGALASGTGPLSLGGTSTGSQWFSGRIDEVRVYNRALTAAEVTADMNTSVRPP
jgi:hypothetical protein